jgi:hypothetical protein
LVECTRTRKRIAHTSALVVAALILTFGWAAQARADGDPASDVLATQTLFLAQDAGVPAAQQSQLVGLLSEAQRAGDPIRAAVIASPTDLGSVTELWRQPAEYARFLGQELSLVYRGLLLVVMPDGYGVVGVGTRTSSPTGLGSPSRALGEAAVFAIQRLAARSGHPLALPTATPSSAGSGGSDALPWVVFAIGAALIAAAWTASLRSRPLGRPRLS